MSTSTTIAISPNPAATVGYQLGNPAEDDNQLATVPDDNQLATVPAPPPPSYPPPMKLHWRALYLHEGRQPMVLDFALYPGSKDENSGCLRCWSLRYYTPMKARPEWQLHWTEWQANGWCIMNDTMHLTFRYKTPSDWKVAHVLKWLSLIHI